MTDTVVAVLRRGTPADFDDPAYDLPECDMWSRVRIEPTSETRIGMGESIPDDVREAWEQGNHYRAEAAISKTIRDCTCLGSCKGKEGLAPGWQCALEASDARALEAAVEKVFGSRPEPTLARRLGWMAEAMVSAKVGPQARFFTRQRVDEIVSLLREAEGFILKGK